MLKSIMVIKMTKPEIIRVYDAENEQDRKDAEQLIGCWVGYDTYKINVYGGHARVLSSIQNGEFMLIYGGTEGILGFRYICEFSNSRVEQKPLVCNLKWDDLSEEQKRSFHFDGKIIKDSPPFYCAANIDQVPADAVGKEWEFSDNAKDWKKETLLKMDNSDMPTCYVFTSGIDCRAFMRPIQQKHVKRMKQKDAHKFLSSNNLSGDFIIKYLDEDNHIEFYKLAEKYISEKLGCEVVIDE